jgi:hypothetical protein
MLVVSEAGKKFRADNSLLNEKYSNQITHLAASFHD